MNLLTESASEDEVKSAIDKHQRVYIEYESPNKTDEENATATGKRKIEVYAYGLTKSGNPVIRAFQNYGPTTTVVPEWKFFRLDGIKSWQTTDEYFDTPISDIYPSIGKFNDNGDETMSVVYMVAKFDKTSKPVSVNDLYGRMNRNDVYKTDTERRMEKLRQQLNKPQNISNTPSQSEQQKNTAQNVSKVNYDRLNPSQTDETPPNDSQTQQEEPTNKIYKTDSEKQMEKLRQQMQNVQKIDLSKIPKR